ncbi:MAG: ATPase domain-containing protein [Nanoarchaeota archaeon]
MKKIKSGIRGLDALIGGGFLDGHSVLICGAPGTGKTIFGLQFLYKGIKEENENGLFVSVEDKTEKLLYYASQFGWSLEQFLKERKIEFMKVPIDQRGFMLVDAITEKAKKINAKRIVIDSLSALSINAKMFNLPLHNQPDPTGTIKKKILKTAGYTPFEDISQFTYLFIDRIGDINATTLFLTDTDGSATLTRDGVSEYVCDGVIFLQLHDTSKNVSRTLSVKKMRGCDIIPGMNSLKFTKSGLEVEEFKAFY